MREWETRTGPDRMPGNRTESRTSSSSHCVPVTPDQDPVPASRGFPMNFPFLSPRSDRLLTPFPLPNDATTRPRPQPQRTSSCSARASSNPFLLFFTSFFFFIRASPLKNSGYIKNSHCRFQDHHNATPNNSSLTMPRNSPFRMWRLPNLSRWSGTSRRHCFFFTVDLSPLSQSPPIRRRLNPL